MTKTPVAHQRKRMEKEKAILPHLRALIKELSSSDGEPSVKRQKVEVIDLTEL